MVVQFLFWEVLRRLNVQISTALLKKLSTIFLLFFDLFKLPLNKLALFSKILLLLLASQGQGFCLSLRVQKEHAFLDRGDHIAFHLFYHLAELVGELLVTHVLDFAVEFRDN